MVSVCHHHPPAPDEVLTCPTALLANAPSARVRDIGCGQGELDPLAAQVQSVDAVDWS